MARAPDGACAHGAVAGAAPHVALPPGTEPPDAAHCLRRCGAAPRQAGQARIIS